jgi:DNA excision repair protein ERCC-2
MPELVVSVRELAAFCHRAGDLDSGVGPSPSASEGVRAHRALGARRGAGYQAEYPVDAVFSLEGLSLRLRGRADGYEPEAARVEEIKTCRVDPARLPADLSRLHLAQAKLYAALIARSEGHESLCVRLTWYQIDRDREWPLDQDYSAAELADFLDDSLRRYARWLLTVLRHRERRDASIHALPFPFPAFRRGQRELAELVYKCVHLGGQLMLEAPTGLGKTAAVLFPAIKALAAGRHEHLVLCTAKHSGRRAAEEALVRLRDDGLIASSLSLTARERICFSPGRACRADDCEFARGYWDRLPAAREEAFALAALDQAALESVARRHRVCPYQLGLDLLPWMDAVVADQHHVFSLSAAIGDLATAGTGRWSVLVDEAHNLPPRARGMYSASVAREYGEAHALLRGEPRRLLGDLHAALHGAMVAAPEGSGTLPPPSLLEKMQALIAAITRQQALAAAPGLPPAVQGMVFELAHFLRVAERYGDDFACEAQDERLHLVCIDPARLLARRHEVLHAVVAFSATLSPENWMRSALGLDNGAVFRRCASPFSAGQLQVCIEPGIDTRLVQRENSLPALVATLLRWLQDWPGNCLIFFPSRQYLERCAQPLQAQLGDRYLWQQPGPGKPFTEALHSVLESRRDVCALCLLGGSYAEGIDLPGDQLRSVVLVGPGLPQPDRDNRRQQAWFESRYGQGFRFASLYPAMQRVNQSLGRVIRGDRDQGGALLIDPRFASPAYRSLLPAHWEYRVVPRAAAAVNPLPVAGSLVSPAPAGPSR